MRDPNVLRKNTHTHTQSVPYINSQNVSKTKPSIFVWAHYYEQRKNTRGHTTDCSVGYWKMKYTLIVVDWEKEKN